jgi:acid phosphatase
MLKPTLVLACALAACGDSGAGPDAAMGRPPPVDAAPTAALAAIHTVVVIYAENRGFDQMYGGGAFPGAEGPADASPAPQLDRDGVALPELPQAWGGVTSPGASPAITQAMSAGLPNAPYALADVYPSLSTATVTHDLVHRFFQNQMQIDGGANDRFAAYSDVGGLVMGSVDGSRMALWDLARHYVLADHFFQGAFGGSFLNHQYLICACAPDYPDADLDLAHPTIAALEDAGAGAPPQLALAAASPASALDGPPVFVSDGNLVPFDYFGDGTFHAVNTMQPPFQPSANAPAVDDATHLFADRGKANTLPPQTGPTIGDQLDGAGVSWAWYAGAWAATTAAAISDRAFPSSSLPGMGPNFQYHHQPFNYYARFDPQVADADRTAHLRDYTDLLDAIDAGTLPDVVFYKPEGDLNQHSGYASIDAGDQHVAALVARLQASPQYAHMLIVITYDENGGWWDHVAPPAGDRLGPGTRVPAIVVSPFAKRGVVDHTPYDTGSIQRFLNRRFGLVPLPGITARDAALAAHGAPAMGDLTGALTL